MKHRFKMWTQWSKVEGWQGFGDWAEWDEDPNALEDLVHDIVQFQSMEHLGRYLAQQGMYTTDQLEAIQNFYGFSDQEMAQIKENCREILRKYNS